MATPVYTSFGSLPVATFGGTGIPNTSVAKTELFVNGNEAITLALTAHQRFSNPVVTDNGAGDYYAGPGSNCGIATDPIGCPSGTQGSLWNFAFYIDVGGTAGTHISDYSFTLWYDFDPGVGTALVDLGTININNAIIAQGGNPTTLNTVQDSQNLMFGFLASSIPNLIDPPTLASFNPNALGEYNFYLGFQKPNTPFTGLVGIDVNVVPVPAAFWLLGSAVGLLGWVRRKAAA